jgi:hypothetical protein
MGTTTPNAWRGTALRRPTHQRTMFNIQRITEGKIGLVFRFGTTSAF